jgi:perosamine synthetase
MIPVNEPFLAKNTLKYVSDCINTGWISSAGQYIQRFEEEFSSFLNVKQAITTTSGTTALHLALASLDIGPGHEVIVPSLTMIAVPYAVLYTGALPMAVDVDSTLYNLDPHEVYDFIQDHCEFKKEREELINKTTGNIVKAIIPVHLYGHPCPMDEILDLAREYNLFVIEDAAEAHGALYHSRREGKSLFTGAYGDVGCFSFYANKIVTTGEGGMVVTNNEKVAERARRLKDLAHSPEKRFLHTELAFNYRLTNLQAAVGVAQLEEIEKFIQIKREMATMYYELLSEVKGLTLPTEKKWAKSVYWMYAIVVEEEFGMSRDKLMAELKEKGIETRAFFFPLDQQPALGGIKYYRSRSFPVADELSEKGLYLPSGLARSKEQIVEVCKTIVKIHQG